MNTSILTLPVRLAARAAVGVVSSGVGAATAVLATVRGGDDEHGGDSPVPAPNPAPPRKAPAARKAPAKKAAKVTPADVAARVAPRADEKEHVESEEVLVYSTGPEAATTIADEVTASATR
ncbi:hypothetical protein [Aeromicrobium alkaliterrae]|uniref:Uncharacterized protein n=1 Tax=Aeromicrobium alkaliterrae TaxID=302168 RepID=A0ABN2JH79_9ACTN